MSDLIWVKPNIQGGIPCIAGTRIPVVAIQSWAQEGFSNERIRDEFPGLTDEQIDAAKAYNAAPVSPDSDLLKEAVKVVALAAGILEAIPAPQYVDGNPTYFVGDDVPEDIVVAASHLRAFLSKVEERGND